MREVCSITDAARPWVIPFVVALGGFLLSGTIVFRFAPEAEGHGTDAAIAAYHHHPRGIRARIPAVKLVASVIIYWVSGGSGGREGPTAQISAGFGSFPERILDTPKPRRTASEMTREPDKPAPANAYSIGGRTRATGHQPVAAPSIPEQRHDTGY